jgi:hypothetical protein
MGNTSKTVKLHGSTEAMEKLGEIGCNAKFVDKSLDPKQVVKNPTCTLYRQCLEIMAHVIPPIANFTCIDCERCEMDSDDVRQKRSIWLSSHV